MLVHAADAALAKIAATLPDRAERHLLHAVSQIRRANARFPATPDVNTIREGCWNEKALEINYADEAGRDSERRILPLSILYLDHAMTLLAWC